MRRMLGLLGFLRILIQDVLDVFWGLGTTLLDSEDARIVRRHGLDFPDLVA